MKHYQSCIAASFVFLSFVVSCPFSVNAVDIGIDDQSGIYEYLDAGQQGLINIDFELNEDQDGNRSKRLQIYALQKLAFQEQSGIYENMDFSVAPSSVTVSGGGGVGFYRHNQNSDPLPATVFSCRPGEIMAQSDEFSITVRYGIDSMNSDCIPYSDSVKAGFKYTGSGYYSSVVYHDSKGFLTDISQSYSIFTNDIRAYTFSQNGIPIVSPGTRCDFVSFGSGSSLDLPTGTVDTSSPWDYYNNTLLPYIQEEFPGFDQYFVFPDGYTPPAQPTTVPIEYTTLPGFDWTFAEDGTLPAGAESVNYDIPDLDTKTVAVPQFDWNSINPAEVIAPVSDGLSAVWALISDILSSFGLFPLVSLSLLVGIITALLLLGR